MRFANQTIFITGATRGIGLAAAKAFAKEGAHVLMTGRDENRLQKEAEEIKKAGGKAWVHSIDVADNASVKQAVDQALKEFGQINILINNAGIAGQGYFIETDLDSALEEMNVNYCGMVRVTHAVLPSMIKQKKGIILNISSLLGVAPFPTEASYCATKAAINSFSQALRGEVSQYGIHVGVVLPGHTDTDMGKGIVIQGESGMTPVEVVADTILRAAERKEKLAVIPGLSSKLMLFVCRHFPGLIEKAMNGMTKKSADKKT